MHWLEGMWKLRPASAAATNQGYKLSGFQSKISLQYKKKK